MNETENMKLAREAANRWFDEGNAEPGRDSLYHIILAAIEKADKEAYNRGFHAALSSVKCDVESALARRGSPEWRKEGAASNEHAKVPKTIGEYMDMEANMGAASSERTVEEIMSLITKPAKVDKRTNETENMKQATSEPIFEELDCPRCEHSFTHECPPTSSEPQEWTIESVDNLLTFAQDGTRRVVDAHNAALAAAYKRGADFARKCCAEEENEDLLRLERQDEVHWKTRRTLIKQLAAERERRKPLVEALEKIYVLTFPRPQAESAGRIVCKVYEIAREQHAALGEGEGGEMKEKAKALEGAAQSRAEIAEKIVIALFRQCGEFGKTIEGSNDVRAEMQRIIDAGLADWEAEACREWRKQYQKLDLDHKMEMFRLGELHGRILREWTQKFDDSETERVMFVTVLEEIAKGEGPYHPSRIRHAENTIAHLKSIAKKVLDAAKDKPCVLVAPVAPGESVDISFSVKRDLRNIVKPNPDTPL